MRQSAPPRENAPVPIDLLIRDKRNGYQYVSVDRAQNRGAHALQGLGYLLGFLPAVVYVEGIRPLMEAIEPVVEPVIEYAKSTDVACGAVRAFVDVDQNRQVRHLVQMGQRVGDTPEAALQRLVDNGLVRSGEDISDRKALRMDAKARLPEPFPRLPYRPVLRPKKAPPAAAAPVSVQVT